MAMECIVRQGLVSDIRDLPATEILLHIVDQLLLKKTDVGTSGSLLVAKSGLRCRPNEFILRLIYSTI